MSKSGRPSDEQIIAELERIGKGRAAPTYYIKNCLEMDLGIGVIKTDFIRRALVRLEKGGKVKRMDSSVFKFMLHWSLA